MVRAPQVFISHDTEDEAFAHRLANDLQGLGLRVWIAPDSIRPGEDWVDAINRGLERSSHMLLVLTPAALRSDWVRKETSAAINLESRGRIELIPLRVKPCTAPPLWDSYQAVPFRHDYQAGLRQLASRLGSQATAPAAPVPARPTIRPTLEEGRLYFTEWHVWVRSEAGTLTSGISNFAQEQLSDIVDVSLPVGLDSQQDEELLYFEQGEEFGIIESVNAAIDLYMPATGRVCDVNEALYDAPEMINEDPHGAGWLIKFIPEDRSELRDLMTDSNYGAYCSNAPWGFGESPLNREPDFGVEGDRFI